MTYNTALALISSKKTAFSHNLPSLSLKKSTKSSKFQRKRGLNLFSKRDLPRWSCLTTLLTLAKIIRKTRTITTTSRKLRNPNLSLWPTLMTNKTWQMRILASRLLPLWGMKILNNKIKTSSLSYWISSREAK